MSDPTILNTTAAAALAAWPHPDAEAITAAANQLGGKEEARHQRMVVVILRRLQAAGLVAHYTVIPNEAMRRRWQHWVMQGAQEGTPDLIVALPKGRTVWMERKAQGGRLSPEQAHARDRLLAGGHIHIVPRSAGEDIAALAAVSRGESHEL